MYSSTCFGSPHAHHQELNNCSSSLWFYLRSVVVAVLLVVVGLAGRPDHDQQMYNSTLSFKVTPWPLYPRERDTVPIVQDAGWASGPVWTGAEHSPPPLGFDPRTVQPVASRHTDWAIAALKNTINATIIYCKKESCLQHATCFGRREPAPAFV
jgi:hypothetical protein